jgi:hypothetical protein
MLRIGSGYDFVVSRTITSLDHPCQVVMSNLQWGMLMKLAFDSGWQPLGVAPPPDYEPLDDQGKTKRWYTMDYFSVKNQHVSDDDARAIASALQVALDDVPEHDAVGHKVFQTLILPNMERPIRSFKPGVKVNPYEFFSGPNKATLVRFIEFFNLGGFRIN